MANDLDQDLDDDKVIEGDDQDDDLPEPTEEGKAEADGGIVVETTEPDQNDEDRQHIREARRQERHDMKQRKREKDERTRRELESLRTRNAEYEARIAAIERKSTGSDMAQIDNTLKTTQQAYAHHKEQLSFATDQSNGKVAAEAAERMMLAKQKIDQLVYLKNSYTQRQSAPAPLDARMVTHANKFMSEHNWYKAGGADTDSVVMRAIDDALATEGWDPKSDEYWDELRVRMKKHLPHRSSATRVSNNDTLSRQKSIVSGSGRESASSGSAGTFKLSADRVAAIKEAGMWSDPKKRAEMVTYYRNYDRTQKNKD